MAWALLACAILTEIAATTALKYTNGLNIFTHTFLTLAVVGLYITSYVCMAQALKLQLEVSVAYAMWSGIGTAAIAVIGAIFFRESAHPVKIGAIALIIVGVAMLNLVPESDGTASHAAAAHTGTARVDMALAEAMSGMSAVGGRHRAPGGVAYPAAYIADPYGDGYGDGYGEPRRARHARPAWGRTATPAAAQAAGNVPTGHVPRPRTPVPADPYAADPYVRHGAATHTPDPYAEDPAIRVGAYVTARHTPDPYDADRYDAGAYAPAAEDPARYAYDTDIPVHQVPAYGNPDALREAALVPLAAPVPADETPTQEPPVRQVAYLGADDATDFRADLDAALGGHDRTGHHTTDDVVEPAAVEPPPAIERQPASVTHMPPRPRAPIKGVTLLHPYPDRPVARTPRSA